jgi:hypothetical protein
MYYADVAGFTCKEIAEIRDTPVGTWLVALLDRSQLVGKRLHRVKGG